MNSTIPVVATCKFCHLIIDGTDNYCRHCGRSLKQGYGFFYSHSGIILLALVLGPFVLPWVWISKRISPTAKVIYSIALAILSYYFVLTCYHLFQFSQETMQLLLGGNF